MDMSGISIETGDRRVYLNAGLCSGDFEFIPREHKQYYQTWFFVIQHSKDANIYQSSTNIETFSLLMCMSRLHAVESSLDVALASFMLHVQHKSTLKPFRLESDPHVLLLD